MGGQNIAHRDLEEWLVFQQQLHPKAIDMGLERISKVALALAANAPNLLRPAPLCITVAGTNGKGSTVALLRALLLAHGLTVGSFTSPHILHYRERIQLSDRYPTDAELCACFAEIDAVRGDISLTYFEYATLAALLLFSRANLDAVVLEVGLGGRLDSVNLVDADAVIITTVDLDHQDYLGHDREAIGAEKAGVLRPEQLVVYADLLAVHSVVAQAAALNANLLRPRLDYQIKDLGGLLEFSLKARPALILQAPAGLRAPAQLHNIGAALALICTLQQQGRLPIVASHDLSLALAPVQVAGRLQLVGEEPEIWIDVAHNPQAAQSLAQWLKAHPFLGDTIAVFGGMQDKDIEGVALALAPYLNFWMLAGLQAETSRGLDTLQLAARLRGATRGEYQAFASVIEALDAAISYKSRHASGRYRVIAFGSFFLVAGVLRALGITELPAPA